MKTVDKASFKQYFDKAIQHFNAADFARKNKDYDAAVTNYSISLINFLDAVAVRKLGKTLNSDNHSAAPVILQNELSKIGIPNFKKYTKKCISVLDLKNKASYSADEHTSKHAKMCRDVITEIREYCMSLLELP